ncbi:toprim domain-containing protein [Photobacterium lipolyticum]|uniref:Toprim domain-containing protein n=1 Tax=Photobacterium lipolyticum TaxID=266810 RepID=A0A2T3MTH8_9GAMM|nr:toprim domain-containing protein [Photobacterium lipolyticum]PSW02559.1 hypothetical protein C9I89_18745 [Photobacterium lipolyticum]
MNISSLLDSMSQVGIFPTTMPSLCDYGQIQRFNIKEDKPDSKNGWLLSFNDGLPIVVFGSWKTGITSNWVDGNSCQLESFNINQIISNARQQAEQELVERQYQAARRCCELWQQAKSATTHPYATNKQINLYGCRLLGKFLLVPIYDINGQLISLQFIQPNGNKYFKAGGRTIGGMCWLSDNTAPKKILICEGYATAATLHQATGLPVVCAFNANNLAPVAVNLSSQHPNATLIICADNDHLTPGNPGITKAKSAAKVAHCFLVIPEFDAKDKSTDFNDIHVNQGLYKVRNLIEPLLMEVTE